jgi:hypothetical protein
MLAFALLALGCTGPATAQRGTSLYPIANTHLRPGKVARLNTLLPGGSAPGAGTTSFITSVDGRDVSTVDTAFELLPGCHFVKTATDLVVTGQNATFTAQLEPRVFAFRMRAGFEYSVIVQVADPPASATPGSVYGMERDPNGARTQEIEATTSAGDIPACRAWTPPPS